MEIQGTLFGKQPTKPAICNNCPYKNRPSMLRKIKKLSQTKPIYITTPNILDNWNENQNTLTFPLCSLVYEGEIVPDRAYKCCLALFKKYILPKNDKFIIGNSVFSKHYLGLSGSELRNFGKSIIKNNKLFFTWFPADLYYKNAPEYIKLTNKKLSVNIPEPIHYKVYPQIIENDKDPRWEDCLRDIKNNNTIYLDIETNGLKDVLFNIGVNANDNALLKVNTSPVITALGIGTEEHIYIFPVDHFKKKYQGTKLKDLILNILPNKTIVGANIGFDLAWLNKLFGMPLPKQARDILFEYYLQWQVTYTGGLKEIAQRLFHYYDWEHDKGTENWSKIPWNKLSTYLAHDINATRMVAKHLWEILQKHPVWNFYINHAINNTITYTDIHIRGVHVRLVDTHFAKNAIKRYKKLINSYAKQAGWKKETINPDSEKDLKELFFKYMNLEPIEHTPSGEPALNKDALKIYAQMGIKIADAILRYRMIAKLDSTYYGVPLTHTDENMIIRPEIGYYRTASGRTACVKPNFQNLPRGSNIAAKKVKQMVVPRYRNGLILETDYSQAELRCLGSVANEPHMIEEYMRQFKDIKYEPDLHTAVVMKMLHIDDYNVAKKQYRHIGKVINFGIVYGMTPKGLSKLIGCTVEEAQEYMAAYFQAVPRVKEYIEKFRRFAKQHGYILAPTGRRRLLPGATNPKSPLHFGAMNKAINTPIQAVASDMKMQAINQLNNLYKTLDVPARVILEVHDSIVTEIFDKKYALDVIQLAEQTMSAQTFPGIKIPLVSDSKIGPSWGETKAVPYKECWKCPNASQCPNFSSEKELLKYFNETNTQMICESKLKKIIGG